MTSTVQCTYSRGISGISCPQHLLRAIYSQDAPQILHYLLHNFEVRSGHGQVPRRLLRSLDAPLVDGSAIGRLPGELYNRAQIDGDGAGDGEVLADGNVAGEGAVDDGRRHEGRLRVDMQHNVVGRDAAVARLRLAREHARVLLHRHRRYSEANLQTSLTILIHAIW